MENRVTKKYINIKDRKFALNKFDPLYGSYMALKMMTASGNNGLDVQSLISDLMGSSSEEFEKTQKGVLKYCSEVLPSGEVPLINEEGNIAVMGLTAPMAMSLFIQTIMFAISDFFEDEALQGIAQQAEEMQGRATPV